MSRVNSTQDAPASSGLGARRRSRSRALLSAATALGGVAGFAIASSPARADDGVYFLGSNCQTVASCSYTLTAPTFVGIESSFANAASPTVTLDGNGANMTVGVADTSFAGLVAATNPTSSVTSLDAVAATFHSMSGQTVPSDKVASIANVLGVSASDVVAKSDLLNALGTWTHVANSIGGAATVDPVSFVGSLTLAERKAFLQPEVSALSVASDGTVDAAAAQVAVAKVLFRTLTVAAVETRQGGDANYQFFQGFATNGVVVIDTVIASMPLDQMSADERAFYEASFLRLKALLAGREVGGQAGAYRVDDLFIAAEADGSAYSSVYGVSGNVLSSTTRVSYNWLTDWSRVASYNGSIYSSNLTSLFTASAQTLFSAGATDAATVQAAVTRALVSAGATVAATTASLSSTNGIALLATNTTGAIDLTSKVAISATGSTWAYGILAQTDSGRISVTNQGVVDVASDNGKGVAAQTATGSDVAVTNQGAIVARGSNAAGVQATTDSGAGAVSATNSGSITVEGTNASGILAFSPHGAAAVSGVNEGAIAATGDRVTGVEVWSNIGEASATNRGRVTADGTGATGIGASSTGGRASAINASAGTITVGGSASSGLTASSTSGAAVASNAGQVTLDGGRFGVVAFSGSGDATSTNAGAISMTSDGTVYGFAGALAAGTSNGTTKIDNSGTITATGGGLAGMLTLAEGASATLEAFNSGVVSVGGAGSGGLVARAADGRIAIDNSGRIDVSGANAVGVAIDTAAAAVTIGNSGTISASGTGASAVSVTNASGIVSFDNSGAIDGAVDLLAGGGAVLSNTGRITGAVAFGAGDDTFRQTLGARYASVNGGAGVDTFVFSGAAGRAGAIDATTLVGFEKGRLSGGADWTLVGNFTGVDFTVDAGSASFSGVLGGVTLATGSALRGSGTVSSITSTGATIAPGDTATSNGVGTISVVGDLRLDAASTVLVDLAGKTSDKIAVGGTASLGNAGLLLRGRDIAGGTTFQILTAGTSVDGTFASTVRWTDGNWDFLGLTVQYDANSVTLKTADAVTQVKSEITAQSRGFLDAVFGETPQLATDGQAEAYRQIGEQVAKAQGNTTEVQKTIDEVSGKATLVSADAATSAVRAVDQAVSRASDAAVGGGSPEANGVTMAYLDEEPEQPAQRAIGRVLSAYAKPPVAHSLVVWTTGQFGFGHASSGTSSSDFRSGGLTMGIIKRIDDAFSVGFAGGYTRSNVDVQNPTSHLGVDSYHLLGHATWETDALRFNGLVGYAFQNFQGRRNVLTSVAVSDYAGGSVRFGLDGGYKIRWLSSEFMPFVGLDVIHGWTAGYTEKGAGVLNLTIEDNRTTAVDGRIGLKWSTRYALATGATIAPMVSAAWVHSFGDDTSTIHGSMVGSSFVMTGPARSRDSLALSTGLTADVGDTVSIYGRYSGRLARDAQAHDFSAGFRYKW